MKRSASAKASSHTTKLRHLLTGYRRRYITALTLIALLVTSGFTLVQYLLSIQKQDSFIINIAGRQRMLSQKIALHALQHQTFITQGNTSADTATSLQTAAKLMLDSHQLLTGKANTKAQKTLSPTVQALYFDGENSLDQRVNNYTQEALKLSQANTPSQLAAINLSSFSGLFVQTLLIDLNKMVSQYEQEANSRIRLLTWIETAIWMIALSVLLLEIFTIFKPMERSIKASFVNLARARKKAERSENTAQKALLIKDQFLANMSHELRTPMNGVIGMLDILLKSPLNPTQKNHAKLASSSAQSLMGLIDDILDISKIEAQMTDLKNTEFNCQKILQECIEPFKLQAIQKGLAFKAELSNIENKVILSDATRIKQVLSNLIDNAIKFTEKGTIEIQAELLEKDSAHFTLAINVSDTGIGIAPDRAAALFDPFTQEDASSTRKYGGTGLGLSIAKKNIELMDGEISAHSELEKGSIFHCQLPVQKVKNSSKDQTIEDNLPAKPEPLIWPDKAALLLVEDNIVNQAVVQGILEHQGLSVEVAENGKHALEQLSNRTMAYDVILMDCQMPEMDGYEATQKIHRGDAGEIHKSTPIIAMTANVMKGDKEKCLDAGMDDYIPKPINPDILLQQLNKWLSTRP